MSVLPTAPASPVPNVAGALDSGDAETSTSTEGSGQPSRPFRTSFLILANLQVSSTPANSLQHAACATTRAGRTSRPANPEAGKISRPATPQSPHQNTRYTRPPTSEAGRISRPTTPQLLHQNTRHDRPSTFRPSSVPSHQGQGHASTALAYTESSRSSTPQKLLSRVSATAVPPVMQAANPAVAPHVPASYNQTGLKQNQGRSSAPQSLPTPYAPDPTHFPNPDVTEGGLLVPSMQPVSETGRLTPPATAPQHASPARPPSSIQKPGSMASTQKSAPRHSIIAQACQAAPTSLRRPSSRATAGRYICSSPAHALSEGICAASPTNTKQAIQHATPIRTAAGSSTSRPSSRTPCTLEPDLHGQVQAAEGAHAGVAEKQQSTHSAQMPTTYNNTCGDQLIAGQQHTSHASSVCVLRLQSKLGSPLNSIGQEQIQQLLLLSTSNGSSRPPSAVRAAAAATASLLHRGRSAELAAGLGDCNVGDRSSEVQDDWKAGAMPAAIPGQTRSPSDTARITACNMVIPDFTSDKVEMNKMINEAEMQASIRADRNLNTRPSTPVASSTGASHPVGSYTAPCNDKPSGTSTRPSTAGIPQQGICPDPRMPHAAWDECHSRPVSPLQPKLHAHPRHSTSSLDTHTSSSGTSGSSKVTWAFRHRRFSQRDVEAVGRIKAQMADLVAEGNKVAGHIRASMNGSIQSAAIGSTHLATIGPKQGSSPLSALFGTGTVPAMSSAQVHAMVPQPTLTGSNNAVPSGGSLQPGPVGNGMSASTNAVCAGGRTLAATAQTAASSIASAPSMPYSGGTVRHSWGVSNETTPPSPSKAEQLLNMLQLTSTLPAAKPPAAQTHRAVTTSLTRASSTSLSAMGATAVKADQPDAGVTVIQAAKPHVGLDMCSTDDCRSVASSARCQAAGIEEKGKVKQQVHAILRRQAQLAEISTARRVENMLRMEV